ncbi:MAG: hypothetical protein PVF68_11435 [Acidobacteriota bacterium]|jgi:hypothetical protein
MTATSPLPSRHRLRVLGQVLEIATDAPDLVQPFLDVFDAFVEDAGGAAPPGEAIGIRIDTAAGRYEDRFREVALASGRLRPAQVYNLLYITLVRSLGDVYLLHGAVVAEGGKAFFVGGPSGSGKSTLAHSLVGRGFGFLGDDLAPLMVADGLIHPFPRRLGFVRDSLSRSGLSEEGARVLGDKAFVGAAELGARIVSEPLPPGAMILMNPYAGTGSEIEVTVGVLAGPEPLLGRLAGRDGVRAEVVRNDGELSVLKVFLSGADAIAVVEEELRRAESQVMFHFRGYGDRKTYAAEPSLTPLPVTEACLELLREALNREPQGALMTRLGGRASAAFYELTSLLLDVPCFRLVPGGVEETADLVSRTLRDLAGA